MKCKFTLFITALLILICCIGAASAAEDISDDTISADSDATVAEQTDDSTLEVNNDENILSSEEDVSTWTDLKNKAENTTDQTINLASGTIDIGSDNIQFENNAVIIGKADSYISGNAAGRIPFTSTSNNALQITFKNVNFRNIQCQMLIQLQTTGTSILENCTFTNITAGTGHDSVVYNNLGTMNITDCTFSDCTSGYGVVTNYKQGSTSDIILNVRGSTFENNYASTEPGCINNCGQLYVWTSTFNNNRAAWWAGAIHTHTNAKSVIRSSSFNGNVAGWNGGALYTYSDLEVYDSNFTNNNCSTNNGGGAIGASNYFFASKAYNVTVNNCRFVDNNNLASNGRGGAISVMNGGILSINGSTFIHNSADIGQSICGYNTNTYSNISEGETHLVITNNYFINHTVKTGTTVYLSGTYTFSGNTFINSPQTQYNRDNNYNGVENNAKELPELLGCVFEEIIAEYEPIYLNPGEGDLKPAFSPTQNGIYILRKGEYTYVSPADWMKDVNITLIGEDRENTLITDGGWSISWSGNPNNSNCSISWINVTFKSCKFIKLERLNFNFINCTFESIPIKFDETSKEEIDPTVDLVDAFNYSFNGCLFVNYVPEVLSISNEGFIQDSIFESGRYSYVSVSNCTFENITADSIFTVYANYISANGIETGLHVKDSIFNNITIKGIVKTVEDSVDSINTDNKYEFTTQKTLASEDVVYVDVPVNTTILTVKVADIKEGEDFTIDVTLSNNLTANVTVVINKQQYNVSVVNGTGSLKVTDKLASNTYNVEAKYAGEYPYAASTANTTFKVEKESTPASDKDKQTPTTKVTKKATKITAKKKTFKVKKKTKKYTITLKAGKKAVQKVKVTLKVGKKTYKATTNKKGKATFKITKLNKKGKYTAVIKFKGNKNFKATSKKVKITVKK